MQLPFTTAQFLDVFAAYNRALWPAALLIWLVTAGATWQLWRRGRFASRVMGATLVGQWAWAGMAYHLVFFREINPAALLFGGLFLLEASLLLWLSVLRPQPLFEGSASRWDGLAWALLFYGLLYPFIGLAAGLTYPRLPTFGVPCPTAIVTTGALLLAPAHGATRVAMVIPILWAAVGGSAAFVLGMRADLVLLLAGGVLLLRLLSTLWSGHQHAA
jgi:hypothetical protein